MLKISFRNLSVATVLLSVVTAIALPVSAHAGNGKANKGKKGNHKARMTICHFDMDGTYKKKSLPLKAAIKHLANHDEDKEPFVGDDGSETCVLVEEPPVLPTCDVTLNDGTKTTITEYVTSRNETLTRYNNSLSSGACRLFYETIGADGEAMEVAMVQLFNGQAPSNLLQLRFDDNSRFDIESEQQYNSCSAEIIRVAQQAELANADTCASYLGQ